MNSISRYPTLAFDFSADRIRCAPERSTAPQPGSSEMPGECRLSISLLHSEDQFGIPDQRREERETAHCCILQGRRARDHPKVLAHRNYTLENGRKMNANINVKHYHPCLYETVP